MLVRQVNVIDEEARRIRSILGEQPCWKILREGSTTITRMSPSEKSLPSKRKHEGVEAGSKMRRLDSAKNSNGLHEVSENSHAATSRATTSRAFAPPNGSKPTCNRFVWGTTLSKAKVQAANERKVENYETFFKEAGIAKRAAEATSDHLKKAIHYFDSVAFYLLAGMYLSLLFVEFMLPFQSLIMYETHICCVRSHF